MNFIEAVVRNPVKVAVGVLLVALFGGIAVFLLPMQLAPEVQTPTLTIETRWPGASPHEVEQEIVQEQEEQLKSVEGVTKMSSESMDSRGRITLEFAIGTDMNEALLVVNSRLQQVRDYPLDADKPVIRTSNLSDRAIAWFILSPRPPDDAELAAFAEKHPDLADEIAVVRRAPHEGVLVFRLQQLAEKHPEVKTLLPDEDLDVTKMRKWAEDVIKARFERVPGVSISNVIGGREEEMQIIVEPRKMAQQKLTIPALRDALRAQDRDISGGDFWEGKRRWVVRTLGQFKGTEDIANRVVGIEEGAPVYVKNIGRVQAGFKKPDGLVRRFGTERLAINALRETGANVLDVMDGLRQATRELNEGILKQKRLSLLQVSDETDYIYSAIGLVQDNILVGGLLTVAVLLLFLRSGRSTLVIALAIPTSIIGTFLVMFLMGRSLNVISLAGLAFAVGMLVDNAIVVLENIYRHHQMGAGPFRAAVRGTQEVWAAVLSSTLTTMAVFIPVLFVQEEAGQLFRDIAIAISAGIGLSLIVSITLIPVAASRLLKKEPAPRLPHESANGHSNGEAHGSEQGQGQWHRHPAGADAANGNGAARPGLFGRVVAHPVVAWPRRVLHAVVLAPADALARGFVSAIVGVNALLQKSILLRVATVGGLTAAAVYGSYALMPKVEYLPSGNRNLVFGIMLPPPGYNLEQMLAIGDQIEKDLRPYWNVDEGVTTSADGKYPIIGDYFFVARGRQLFMGLKSVDPQRVGELIPLIQKVTANVPGMFTVAKQSSLFEQGLSAGRTIDVEIVGPDLKKLVRLGGQVLGQVKQIMPDAQVRPVPSLDLSSPEVHVVPIREKAAQNGIPAREIGYIVDALVDGAYVADYQADGTKIDLRIIGRDELASRTQDLASLPLATPHGQAIPLKGIANVYIRSGPEQINHRERLRAITIEVSPPPELPLEEAMQIVRDQIVQPLIDSGEMESGLYQVNLEGTSDKLQSTWEALRWNFLLALLITYLLMAALFESWLYPFVVILSVPLGIVGGMIGLWLLNLWVLQPLDVLTMLGFVILIGTVVNNPILIVEQSLVHMREEKMPMRAAILESVRNRIRPIFMTTTTTVFGLLPLVLFPGAGSELYRGLGAVVLGGLLISTIVSLVVVPTLFSLTMETKQGLYGWLGWDASEEKSEEWSEAQAPALRRETAVPVS